MKHGAKIVEKKNRNSVHGIFCSRAAAEQYFKDVYPGMVDRKSWDDKSLTLDDFEVIDG